MRLDQNRAASQLAKKAGVGVGEVSNMIVWGNHSANQVPDYCNARIGGRPATAAIADTAWLQGDFLSIVGKRGAAVIEARGKSSAASAASSAIDAVKALVTPTPAGTAFSSAVCTDGNPYGLPEGLIFGLPCRSQGDGNYEVVPGYQLDEFLKGKLKKTTDELLEERTVISGLLK
jgi:malate dehydrogenase